jgi:hypothetical protein
MTDTAHLVIGGPAAGQYVTCNHFAPHVDVPINDTKAAAASQTVMYETMSIVCEGQAFDFLKLPDQSDADALQELIDGYNP